MHETTTTVTAPPATISDPFPYGLYGDDRPMVRTLTVPRGTQRIWRNENTHRLTLRDQGGFGPKGHTPVGWITPDDQILLEDRSGISPAEVAYLARFFTGANRHIDNVADMDEASRHAATQGRCIRCDNITGKPHLPTCPHRGKLVGDNVG